MSVDLCEHNLPIRACEICREAADLLGKGDNVLISRSYLTEWVREAHKYQDALKLLEVTEKENAALQVMLEKCNSKFIVELEAKNAELREEVAQTRKDARRYWHVRKNPAMLLHLSNKGFDEAIDVAIAQEGK